MRGINHQTMKRFFSRSLSQVGLLSIIALLLTFAVFHGNAAWAATGKVTILHTNDMHSHLLGFGPNQDYTPLMTGDDITVGGFARIAGKVNEIRTERNIDGTPVLLLDGGDFMMGSAFSLLRGAAELSLMDHLGYDVITIGNHEFDWMPSGTAQIFSNIPNLGLNLPVVASNLIFDEINPGDDALKALYDDGVIQPWYVKTLVNGIKAGFFGILGEDAASVAPFAYPVDFEAPILAARKMVADLQAENVDLIICLSHSGITEDTRLAYMVSGIDVIISGHTHETTSSPVQVGNTIVVQAGSYTRDLGVLDLDISASGVSVDRYELVPIDDAILGDAVTQGLVDSFQEQLDEEVLWPMGYGFSETIAETAFDLTCKAGVENNLGNLVTDAMRWMVDQHETGNPVDFAIESNGVIRDDLLKGKSSQKNIAFSDAFGVLPLGFGLDGAAGYPMVSIYVYPHEVKKAVEVLASVYPLLGSDYWLNLSGLRAEYMPLGIPFFKVRRLYVGDEVNGYASTPLDTSLENKTLYKVAINYYVAQFIAVVGDYTFGILTIDPKDKDGNSYLDESFHPDGLDEARVDTDPAIPGIQELQEWEGFVNYFATFSDLDSNGAPEVPAELYEAPTGRIKETLCFISTAAP